MKTLRNWFIGDYLNETSDVFERSKIQLLYNYAIAYFIIGTLFYIGIIYQEIWYHVYAITIAVVGLGALPFILKYTKNIRFSSNWLIIQQMLVSALSIFIQEGKNDTAGSFWLIVFILLSFFLYGKKWGIILILIMFIVGAVAAGLSTLVDIPDNQQFQNTPDTFLVPLFLIIIVVWMFVQTRSKAEEHIKKQQQTLELKNKEIENNHKDITDSINYAKKIQGAVLPPVETIQRSIPLSFIFYQPKDIVSGDFFWFHEIDSDQCLLVCGDCTGHGVPGAFMTVIGSNLLNQIVIENKIFEPSQILNDLDKQINFTLKQEKSRDISVQDGMDLSLIKINKKTKTVTVASAKRPVILIRKKELSEIKANKFSLGGSHTNAKTFEETTLPYHEDDMLYLFTDGYPDQFGGEKGKKFSTKRLKQFFESIHLLSMIEQRQKLATEIKNWQNNLEQIDDILVIGIKF